MNVIVEALNPLLWAVAALGAVAALRMGPRAPAGVRFAAATLLALSALGLLAAVAVADWLPPRALLVHADGSTDDPRAISAVVLGLAALLALLPAVRSLRLPQLGVLGLLLPGLAIAGLVAATSSFVGLRAPMALVGIVLAGVALGTGLAVLARVRWSATGMFALQLAATGLLLVGAVLSMNGARAESLTFAEGAPVDTLGSRLVLGHVEAPHDSLRRMEFLVVRGERSATVWASLEGRAGTESRSVAGGSLLDGPIVVPIGLQESRPEAHDVVWLSKGDSTTAGASTIRFVGFRILPGDTVRMLADLDVTTAGRTQRVSPGMYATSASTTPFAEMADGLGPIAVGKMDADNRRIALMLPTPSTSAVNRVVIANVHLRPALPVAWLAAGLLALAFLLGFAAPRERPAESA